MLREARGHRLDRQLDTYCPAGKKEFRWFLRVPREGHRAHPGGKGHRERDSTKPSKCGTPNPTDQHTN